MTIKVMKKDKDKEDVLNHYSLLWWPCRQSLSRCCHISIAKGTKRWLCIWTDLSLTHGEQKKKNVETY